MTDGAGEWWGHVFVTVVVVLSASVALAEPYWIAYEGDQFPEAVGWRRRYGNEHGPYAGGAERSLSAGLFTLDSLRHDQIFDFYDIVRPMNPGPGEVFVAEWRVFVGAESDPFDAGVVIARDEPGGHVTFRHGPTGVIITTENVEIPLQPGVFHSFAFRSTDMERFDLSIDGEPAYGGYFKPSLNKSYITFGDGVQGQRSLSTWDYMRFGVVPEPASVLLLLACGAVTRRREA